MPAKIKFTEEEIAEICRLYNSGTSAAKISIMFNIYTNKVRDVLRKYGYNTNPQKINYENYIGKQFGRWTVLGIGERDKDGRMRLKCQCSCINKTIKLVDFSSLKKGTSQSCGCIQQEEIKNKALIRREQIIKDGVKYCTKCMILKKISEFSKLKKGGFNCICKECIRTRSKRYRKDNKEKTKEYRERNKDKNSKYQEVYRKEHKNKNADYQREYRGNNKDYLSLKKVERNNSPAKYSTYSHKLTTEESPIEDNNGLMLCKCTKCREYYYPSTLEVVNRISSLVGKSNGELRLYCSDKCKYSCDIYYAQSIPKSLRNVKKQARCNQPINREALLALQIDECGYNYCEKCGKEFGKSDIALHHNIMVSKDHDMADDMSHQLLLCKKCHKHKGC